MPTEIHIVIVNNKQSQYTTLKSDLEGLHSIKGLQYETHPFDKGTDFHDYLRDRFDGHNPSMWPKDLGKIVTVLDTLEKDADQLEKGVALEDLMSLTYLNRSKNYNDILTGIYSLIDDLKAISDPDNQIVFLYWL